MLSLGECNWGFSRLILEWLLVRLIDYVIICFVNRFTFRTYFYVSVMVYRFTASGLAQNKRAICKRPPVFCNRAKIGFPFDGLVDRGNFQ